MTKKIKRIYQGNDAKKWIRNKAHNISDLIGKSYLIDCLNPIVEGKNVLDIGCGEGYISRKISKKSKKIVGIDSSQDMIKLAKKQSKNQNIQYKCLDLRKLDKIKEKFDLIIISLVLHYFKSFELESIANKIVNHLNEKGEIFVLEVNPYSMARNKSSKWLRHDKIEAKQNKYIFLETYILSNDYKKVGFYYFGLQFYINSFISAGCILNEIKDLNASKSIIHKYPSLNKERDLYLFMHFIKKVN